MDPRRWTKRWHQPTGATVVRWLACAAAACVVALPLTVLRAVETVHFPDELGTFPVEIQLSHNGFSTLDTGLLGKVYLARTGAFGFGVRAIATGPPEAGGTLASYVDPAFLKANAALIDDPDRIAAAYSAEIGHRLRSLVGVAGGQSR